MGTLGERSDYVIGVDTHKNTNTAALLASSGQLLHRIRVGTTTAGYQRLLSTTVEMAPGERIWAVEGAGNYGAGLVSYLLDQGEQVASVDHFARPRQRRGAKSDELDAERIAREASHLDHLPQPRQRGDREALRVLLVTRRQVMADRTRAMNALGHLVIGAPDSMRRQLNHLKTDHLVERCAHLRISATQTSERRATATAMRSTARRAIALAEEAAHLEAELRELVIQLGPASLLQEPGVGVVSAAQILCSWSHQGRIRSEAAFAMLAGVAPLEASSGETVRHRLNRTGDRHLNCALYFVVLSRLQHDPRTRAYAARRRAEGKSSKEIIRCLKRHVARHLFRLLESESPAASRLHLPTAA